MRTSEFWQRVSATPTPSEQEWSDWKTATQQRTARSNAGMSMILDALSVVGAALVAAIIELHSSPIAGMRGFWRGTLIRGQSMGTLTCLLVGFMITLIAISRGLHLYTPTRLNGYLHEQRLSIQACLISGLLLIGTLYLIRAEQIPHSVVILTIGLLTATLSARRVAFRALLYQRFERGMYTRNAIIVGAGAEAHALRHHLQSIRQLGYNFKGFVHVPGVDTQLAGTAGDVLGSLDSLFDYARKHYIDEIFFTSPVEHGTFRSIVDLARASGILLRVVPDMYDGLIVDRSMEYVGRFPTIPISDGHVPTIAIVFKRLVDIVFSILALSILSPLMLAVAIAIKLDSPGPVFYISERIGKKARVFKCIKFRTMVRDAGKSRAEYSGHNEPPGIWARISSPYTSVSAFSAEIRRWAVIIADRAGWLSDVEESVVSAFLLDTGAEQKTSLASESALVNDFSQFKERQGILFKINSDPRITRIGRILRKYSIDELPKFFNVLIGDMSIVGPRPPIAAEVRQYNLARLRRLDVTPGMTGLWQVQARQDPSFDSYISLDVAYIDNWSVWLDIQIMLQSIGLVLSGTGT